MSSNLEVPIRPPNGNAQQIFSNVTLALQKKELGCSPIFGGHNEGEANSY